MITVTGSLAFDHIMDYPGKFSDHIMPDKIHQINLSFLVNNLTKQKGGTAGNIAYNLALLKNPVSILAVAGADFSEYEKFLQQNGVNTSQIKISNSSTSSAYIMTDLTDNQITAFHPGAMNDANALSLNNIKTDLVVISPNNPQAMIKFCKQCQDLQIPYLLDPGMQLPALDPDNLRSMVNGAAILIGNDYEMELLREKLALSRAEGLLEQVKILITTLGGEGSTIQTINKTYTIPPAKPISAIDPTGAGDAYRAGFLTGYLKGLNLRVCGQIGSLAACYAIEKYGTTNHKFTVQEFNERYKSNFGSELKLS